MAKTKIRKNTVRGQSQDADIKWLESGFEPPRIDLRKTIERLEKQGHKTRCGKFSYSVASKLLGLKNSNNISKWFHPEKSQQLTFNSLKSIMWLLNCGIEELIESPKKLAGGSTEGYKKADELKSPAKKRRKARVK